MLLSELYFLLCELYETFLFVWFWVYVSYYPFFYFEVQFLQIIYVGLEVLVYFIVIVKIVIIVCWIIKMSLRMLIFLTLWILIPPKYNLIQSQIKFQWHFVTLIICYLWVSKLILIINTKFLLLLMIIFGGITKFK